MKSNKSNRNNNSKMNDNSVKWQHSRKLQTTDKSVEIGPDFLAKAI